MSRTEPAGSQELQTQREELLTESVLRSFENTPDERLRHLVRSLVTHLHAFAREVRLTSAEWDAAIEFLTRAGHITDDKRQEFILLSDVLGLSMLVVGMNSSAQPEATESTVFGPFFVANSPEVPLGGDVAEGVPGKRCRISGTVTDTGGAPVPGARIEIWGADEAGFYDVQYEGDILQGRAHIFSDADGRYWFWTVQPVAYPIPGDGPVGSLLSATRRSIMRPAHVHFKVTKPGYEQLVTHIFVAGAEHLGNDAVFGVKESLIVEFVDQPPGTSDERELDTTWSEAEFDIVLAADPASPPD